MKVLVEQIHDVQFRATSERGATLIMDGPEDLGGANGGLRPMETVLAGLAGCSGIDVVMILRKQREPAEGLRITLDAQRKDTVPAVFERIHIRFEIGGGVSQAKLDRAVALSMEKYCSVAKMLMDGGVDISWEAVGT
jgi:putative redox protein